MRQRTLPSSLVSLIEHAIEDEGLCGVVGADREVLHDVFLTKWRLVISIYGVFFDSRLNEICVVSQGLIASHELFLDREISLLRRDCMALFWARTLGPLWIVKELLILRLLLCQALRLVVIIITPNLPLSTLLPFLELLHLILYTCIPLILSLCLLPPRLLLGLVQLPATTATCLLLFRQLTILVLPLILI